MLPTPPRRKKQGRKVTPKGAECSRESAGLLASRESRASGDSQEDRDAVALMMDAAAVDRFLLGELPAEGEVAADEEAGRVQRVPSCPDLMTYDPTAME